MKNKKFVLIPLLMVSTLLSGCDISSLIPVAPVDEVIEEEETQDPPVVEETFKYDYTLMLYMSGSTLEYDASGVTDTDKKVGLLSEDIIEILSVSSMPDNLKIIIETGGTETSWALPSSFIDGDVSEISTSKLQRWEVIKTENKYHIASYGYFNYKIKLVKTLDTNFLASEESFESFLDWGIKNYNAKQMGVIISGHGGGIAGCAYDDNNTYSYRRNELRHTLDTAEIYKATKSALSKNNKQKFTWIGFDCCLMGCADIASMLSDYYGYMIASQENELGTGWDFDLWISKIVQNIEITPAELLDTICLSFVAESHDVYCVDYLGYYGYCDQTLAAYDLSKMDNFIDKFDALLDVVNTDNNAYYKYNAAFRGSTTLNKFGDSCYGLADFSSFLTTLNNNVADIESEVSDLKQAITDLVISNHYCSNYSISPCGINIFMPESLSTDGYGLQLFEKDYNTEYHTKFTRWQTMCLNNW